MKSSWKNVLIGLFVTGALFLLIVMVLFLKPRVGDMKKTLRVRFSNLTQINVGTRVLLAGRPIGQVVDIQTVKNSRQEGIADDLGRAYIYEVTLKYSSDVNIYTSDEIGVQTAGLLGEKAVAIIPRRILDGAELRLIGEGPVNANAVEPFENLLEDVEKLSTSFHQTLTLTNSLLVENRMGIKEALTQFGGAMKEAKEILQIAKQSGLVDDFAETVAILKQSVQDLEEGGVFENSIQIARDLKSSSTRLSSLLTHIEEGKGTLGKIIASDDLYFRLVSTFGKANVLFSDINNFGLLFSSNKQWQRLRLQRSALLSSVRTPMQFKDYFEKEAALIESSMGRLGILIEKYRLQGFDSMEFKKEFKELLNSASDFDSSLKLYSEKLIQE